MSECKHQNTEHFHWKENLVDVELCLSCGMSRSTWEQGHSGWIYNPNAIFERCRQLRSEIAAASRKAESNDFWKGIVLTEEGKLNVEQVQKELEDFRFIIGQVPQVYLHITNGNLSKVNYYATAVISEADRVKNEEIEEAIKEAVEEKDTEIEGLKNVIRSNIGTMRTSANRFLAHNLTACELACAIATAEKALSGTVELKTAQQVAYEIERFQDYGGPVDNSIVQLPSGEMKVNYNQKCSVCGYFILHCRCTDKPPVCQAASEQYDRERMVEDGPFTNEC